MKWRRWKRDQSKLATSLASLQSPSIVEADLTERDVENLIEDLARRNVVSIVVRYPELAREPMPLLLEQVYEGFRFPQLDQAREMRFQINPMAFTDHLCEIPHREELGYCCFFENSAALRVAARHEYKAFQDCFEEASKRWARSSVVFKLVCV